MESDKNVNTDPAQIWMRQDGTYLNWSQKTVSASPVEVIRSALGTICEVSEDILLGPSLTTDEVVELLTPHVTSSLDGIRETLRTISPKLESSGAPFDLRVELPLILKKHLEAPETTLGALGEFMRHAALLAVVVDFGPASEKLVELMGSGLEPLFARHEKPPEEDLDLVKRVRAEVRAELDKYCEGRPPMSFDFSELKKSQES